MNNNSKLNGDIYEIITGIPRDDMGTVEVVDIEEAADKIIKLFEYQ